MTKHTLLLIDDEPAMGTFVRGVAEGLGFAVETTAVAEDFKNALQRYDPSVIVLDVSMPKVDGIELTSHLAEIGTRAKILILSGFDETVRRMALHIGEARGLHMAGVLAKPIRAADLREQLARLIEPS